MTIRALFDTIPLTDILGISSPEVLTLPCAAPKRDSRKILAGDVFFCIRGRHHDGHTDLAAASYGAVCAVIDRPDAIVQAEELSLPWILVRDTAAVFLPACLAYYGHPERSLHLYAVTGTNGKTSVTYLLEAIFSAYPPSSPCAVFGTVENRIAGVSYRTENTTPAPEITAELLSRARDAGVKTVIMEASSHALEQNRLSGLTFDCGIFTNFSEDHLDYHPTMEDYFLAKRKLFFSCRRALYNIDDPHGMRLFCDPDIPAAAHAYALNHPLAEFSASCLPDDLTDAPCDFLAANRLAAAACASMASVPTKVICTAIRFMQPIPGRMERVLAAPYSVYLDYAHTPDALKRVLQGLGKQTTGALCVLFGCGGDRERQKRPMMGAIAAALADRIILTADNSRSEDVRDILTEILGGIVQNDRHKVTVITDRRAAILHALNTAKAGDTVLLAGKGHETYQTDQTGTHPFSEREIIRAYQPFIHTDERENP